VVQNLGANPLVIQLPIGSEEAFAGLIDLVKMKALVWNGEELGATWEELDIPADMAKDAAEWREKLIDAVVEMDDDVMMAYLDVSGAGCQAERAGRGCSLPGGAVMHMSAYA